MIFSGPERGRKAHGRHMKLRVRRSVTESIVVCRSEVRTKGESKVIRFLRWMIRNFWERKCCLTYLRVYGHFILRGRKGLEVPRCRFCGATLVTTCLHSPHFELNTTQSKIGLIKTDICARLVTNVYCIGSSDTMDVFLALPYRRTKAISRGAQDRACGVKPTDSKSSLILLRHPLIHLRIYLHS